MVLDLVVAGAGDRLDRVLPRVAPGLSRRQARGLIAQGAVFIDGRRCRVASRKVEPGAKLRVHLAPVAATRAAPAILFQDERITVVDKPAGVHVNESGTTARLSLLARMPGRCYVVHRLDLETTGVIVFAKSAEVAARLSAAFRARHVDKRYIAMVEGRPEVGFIDARIGPDRRRPRARTVRADGQEARTEVVAVVPREGCSEVHLRLETGRTHQIRVHLAHAGHPVLGDPLYGGMFAVRAARGPVRVSRTLLHARRLRLPGWDPFEAPLPADMVQLGGG